MNRILFAATAFVLIATAAIAQDATVAVTAPEINPALTAYEQARSVIVDAVLALGAIGIAYLGRLVAQLLGEGIANQVRAYMNGVFTNVVATQMARTQSKASVIEKSAEALKEKIPDALAKFGLDQNPRALNDKIEAEIAKVNLDAAHVPPKEKK